MYYCYIAECSDGSYYTGITTDLVRRLEEHNSARGSRYTASHRPVHMVWNEEHPNRSSAQRREAQIKRFNRDQKETMVKGKTVERKVRHK